MKKYFIIAVTVSAFIPSLAFAAWWNPLTWDTASPLPDQSSQVSSLNTQIASLQQTIAQQNSEINSLNGTIASMSSSTPEASAPATPKVVTVTKYLPCATTNSASPTAPVATPVQPTPAQIAPASVTIQAAPASAPSSATISIDTASPKAQSVEATDIADGQYLGLPILVFDVNPSGNNFYPNSLNVNIAASGEGTVGTAYLYQGSPRPGSNQRPIATAIISNDGTANFGQISNLETAPVDSGQINTFTVAVDVTGLTTFGYTETVSAAINNFSLIDSKSNVVNTTGNVVGAAINVENDI